MNQQNKYDSQLFLLSIGAPLTVALNDWSEFIQYLKSNNIISLDFDSDHSDYVALQDFSIMFEEFPLIGLEKPIVYKKGNAVKERAEELLPPMIFNNMQSARKMKNE